jgi:simple sugar transport system permease protein
MTATTTPTTVTVHPAMTAEQRKHARNIGIVYLVLSGIVLIFFVRRSGTATFGLDAGRTWGVPSAPVAWTVAVTLAALGGIQLARGLGKFSSAALGIGAGFFMFSFLSWAVAGHQTSLTGMLNATIYASVPLILGALSGIICERSGIINIAIEALLLGGAFTSTVVGSAFNNLAIGAVAAIVIGSLLALLLAWLSIRFRVDQVIAGFAINFLILGLTSFLEGRVLVENPQFNDVSTLRRYQIPGLSSIPLLGSILFDQTILTYIAYALVAITWFALFRTRWGLRTRAVGEYPRAADTLGVNVNRTRYRNLAVAGAIGGLGGVFFTADTGRFVQNETAGRGFIALAAVIFGRWNPVGAMAGALVFAFFDAMQLRLSTLQTGIPSEFLQMAPYVATIIVVAGFIGRSRGPAAAGQPYETD